MSKKPIHRLDELVALELGLELSGYTAMIHHASKLHGLLDSLIFVYETNDLICYDVIKAIEIVNGPFKKVKRFKTYPSIMDRLESRFYKRWYIRGNGKLIPLNISKFEDLKNTFYFSMDNDPHYRTQIIFNMETPFIRKKPLIASKTNEPTWDNISTIGITNECRRNIA